MAEEKKPAERMASKGCWAIVGKNHIILENSKMRALELAVDLGAKVQFVEWGKPINQAPSAQTMPAEDQTESY